MSFIGKIFGDPLQREVRRQDGVVSEINSYEVDMRQLSDADLAAKTHEFRKRMGTTEPVTSLGHPLRGSIGEPLMTEEEEEVDEELEASEEDRLHEIEEQLDEILPEAFAVVREASRRILGMRHYDVQLIGGIALHQGKISEMKTGEGKTLVATLALYLNALAGYGAHLVTVNDYLARRDAGWNAPLYHFLGMQVGVISGENTSFVYDPDYLDETHPDDRLQHLRPCTRREAYLADITYCTNNELGFDYLRDNMVPSLQYCVQRRLHYAIVDEADSILIDEARTPLIISGRGHSLVEKYNTYARIVPQLNEEVDFTVDDKSKSVTLTEDGIDRVEKLTGIDDFYGIEHVDDAHKLNQALRALVHYQKDRDYIVKDGEVVIVDEFTGRTLQGRRWSDGLHQAVEAKEGMTVKQQEDTLATITFQNYFRLYDKLAGMTGTALTEAEEFDKIYALEVLPIPPNRPMVRKDESDVVFRTEEVKYKAIVDEIVEAHASGQPILVGTTSIDKSELIARLLDKRGVRHNVLNAKFHEKEATIIAEAGQKNTVTIATNMAGRGTDIVLGEGAADAGGLYIIGTERHESRRIDNQLRGRSGRQGDPGMTRFFLSLEDDLFRIFGGERMEAMLDRLRVDKEIAIESKTITRQMEGAQARVEGMNFDTRRNLVEYDDVMNTQREIVYGERRKILEGADTKANIIGMIHTLVETTVPTYCESKYKEQWDIEGLDDWVRQLAPLEAMTQADIDVLPDDAAEMPEAIFDMIVGYYEVKEAQHGPEILRQVEQQTVLGIIDQRWSLYLTEMEHLKEGVKFRGYAQEDPVIVYKRMAHESFEDLLHDIQFDIVRNLLHRPIQVINPQEQQAVAEATATRQSAQSGRADLPNALIGAQIPPAARPAAAAASAALARRTSAIAPGTKLTYNRQDAATAVAQRSSDKDAKVGRNDLCPCGSGKKYKRCHGMT